MKAIFFVSTCDVINSPVEPSPVIILITPFGILAFWHNSAKYKAVNEVNSAGGDIYKNFKWEILDRIFKLVYLENSALIALHQNKYCMRDDKISLDLGPFVKAIEYSSGKKSILMGKPEKNFFDLAVKDLEIIKDNILMIGDDITSDIEGSINANLKAIQVKTGKFQEKDLEHTTQPNYRIESINDLPKLIGY